MKKNLLLCLFLTALTPAYAQGPVLGSTVPGFSIPKAINADGLATDFSQLHDKVVVLDFWATWCGPCIQSFPKLEALQEKYAGKVQFIAVTDEPEARIVKFLEKRPTALPIVSDMKREIAALFPHRTIPHTVVIDRGKIVRAVVASQDLTAEVLEKALRNEAAGLPEKRENMTFDPSQPLSGDGNHLFQLTMTAYQPGLPSMLNPTGSGVYAQRRILATNVGLKTLYEIAYEFSDGLRTRIEAADASVFTWSKENALCFDLIVPEALGEKRFDIMQAHLGMVYGYRVNIEKRATEVKVLRPIGGQTVKLVPGDSGGEVSLRSGGSGLSMSNAATEHLAQFLQSRLNLPVLDETGMEGVYNLEIPWFNENPGQIHEELKKLGLELLDANRNIDILVIGD